jgi:uncharacterized alpha-E superfamily protein
MGRYLERTEHMARYLRVQYFTTQSGLDCTMNEAKKSMTPATSISLDMA